MDFRNPPSSRGKFRKEDECDEVLDTLPVCVLITAGVQTRGGSLGNLSGL